MRNLTLAISVFILIGCVSPALAAEEGAKPSEVRRRVQEFIDKKEIAGAVTLVATRERVLQLETVGEADIATHAPMKPDTIFWIASMTKPVTGAAVMMMQDEGKLSVDDPVGKYIPELANLTTPEGKAAKVTIRHLLTHTSGMAEATGEQSRAAKTLADLIPAYAAKPLGFEPGSKWQYCQSGINTAARIVELVSGKNFADFVQERIFAPLGMKDTTFYPSKEQVARLAKSYKLADGKLEEAKVFILEGHDPASRERYPAANGGLFSTAPDYAKFCRMVLGGGRFDGKQYIKAQSVNLMTSLQTPGIKTGFTPGNGWGLGWCVVREPQGVTAMLSPDSYGHGGAYGTQAWIDPQKGVIYILMVQRANFPNSDDSPVRKAFQEAASAALAR
jgi:CubicO group peptidase (beta-lactamase class C family)